MFVIDYILRRALQAHNNSCCQFCECVWCMCMLWEEVEHAVWHVPGGVHGMQVHCCLPCAPRVYRTIASLVFAILPVL